MVLFESSFDSGGNIRNMVYAGDLSPSATGAVVFFSSNDLCVSWDYYSDLLINLDILRDLQSHISIKQWNTLFHHLGVIINYYVVASE